MAANRPDLAERILEAGRLDEGALVAKGICNDLVEAGYSLDDDPQELETFLESLRVKYAEFAEPMFLDAIDDYAAFAGSAIVVYCSTEV